MISGCVEEVGAFGGEEAVEDVADALDKGVDGALVEEDEAMRIDEGLGRPPQLAAGCDVGPVLLGRAQGFF